MMDWVRLKSSSKDLPQLKGASPNRNITTTELAQHKSQYDGWIAFRGIVYNVSAYLPYHPGGKDIIVKCLGRDATKEFDKFHKWVNLNGLIGVLKIGVYVHEDKKGGGAGRSGGDDEDDSGDDDEER
jgi:cytochrome-b5 reductase